MSDITQAHASVHQKNFTMIQNCLIQKANISSQATFLLIYLISFSEGWIFHDSMIMERMGCKIDKLRSLFSELRKAGYVKTISIPGPKGTFSGRKRIFAAEPIFFIENQNSKPANPRPIRTSPKVGFSRCSVKPEARVKPTLNTNTKYSNKKNKFLDNNNKGVVVSDINYLERKAKMDELLKLGLRQAMVERILNKFTITRIADVIRMYHEANANSPGWIISALKEGWTPCNDKSASWSSNAVLGADQQMKAIEDNSKRAHEERLAYYLKMSQA